MKKLAFVLCSALLLGACSSSVTAPQHEQRIRTEEAKDTVMALGGSGMGSGN